MRGWCRCLRSENSSIMAVLEKMGGRRRSGAEMESQVLLAREKATRSFWRVHVSSSGPSSTAERMMVSMSSRGILREIGTGG